MRDEEKCQGMQLRGSSFSGMNFLVVGSGISGIGSAGLLEHMGAKVVLYDSNEKLAEEKMRALLPEGSRTVCVAGKLPESVAKETKTVVLSPGVI